MMMKFWKRIAALTCVLTLCLGCAQAALPATVQERLDALGLSETDRQAFMDLAEQGGAGMTEADLLALAEEFAADYQQDTLTGVLQGDLYTHPLGFQLQVPTAWSINENVDGAVVAFFSEADEQGFMPTLDVFLLDVTEENPLDQPQETWDAQYGAELQDYLTLSFEPLLFKDVPALEHVYTHTDPEYGSLLTQQFVFEKDELRVMIVLCIRNEEIDPFLEIYDQFLLHFETGV